MSRPLCVGCKKEMSCSKTGRVVVWERDEKQACLQHGDEYECLKCGHKTVLFGATSSFWAPIKDVPKEVINIP